MAVEIAEPKPPLKLRPKPSFSPKFSSPRKFLVSRKVENRAGRSSLLLFLGYVRPYSSIIIFAVASGMLKFTLPASLAVTLRFVTDRLVPQTGAADHPDASYAFTLRYLDWAGAHLPGALWRTPWGQLNVLMGTLFGSGALLVMPSRAGGSKPSVVVQR